MNRRGRVHDGKMSEKCEKTFSPREVASERVAVNERGRFTRETCEKAVSLRAVVRKMDGWEVGAVSYKMCSSEEQLHCNQAGAVVGVAPAWCSW